MSLSNTGIVAAVSQPVLRLAPLFQELCTARQEKKKEERRCEGVSGPHPQLAWRELRLPPGGGSGGPGIASRLLVRRLRIVRLIELHVQNADKPPRL